MSRGGQDLRLRPYKPSDSCFLMEWLTDQRTVELWRADRFVFPLTEEQLSRYWNDFLEDENAFIFTALDEDGKVCGHFSFRDADYGRGSVHMGFIVVDPAARGKGYGRRMAELALLYAFSILGMRRVTLGVFDCNQAALRCYESAGFRRIDGKETRRGGFCGESWEYFYMEAGFS